MLPHKIYDAHILNNNQLKTIGELMLRPEDKAELEAATGQPSGWALVKAVEMSNKAYYVTSKRGLVCLFGIVHLHHLRGRIVWMVATPQLLYHIKTFSRVSKKVIANWLNKYEVLHNLVDERNEVHIKWLKHMGFTFPPYPPIIKNGVKFLYFIKEK